MANFGYLQAPVLSKIFKTFCCNFYGSPIWDFNSTGFRKICTTWNIAAIVDVNSCNGAKFAFLRSLGVDIFKHTLCEAIQQVPLSKITVEQQADIENLRNFMFVRSEQSFIEGFDDADIDCMIQYITGH